MEFTKNREMLFLEFENLHMAAIPGDTAILCINVNLTNDKTKTLLQGHFPLSSGRTERPRGEEVAVVLPESLRNTFAAAEYYENASRISIMLVPKDKTKIIDAAQELVNWLQQKTCVSVTEKTQAFDALREESNRQARVAS